MCVSDWRLGRLIRSTSSLLLLPQASFASIPSSSQRVGIMIVPNADDQIAITIKEESSLAYVGACSTFIPSWKLNVTQDGDLPTKGFRVSQTAAGDVTVGVTEWFLPENVLTEALESLYREYPQWRAFR